MQLSLPLFALFLVLLPMIFLAVIATIFHEVAATITLLQRYIINCGDATRSATHDVRHTHRFCAHLTITKIFFVSVQSNDAVLTENSRPPLLTFSINKPLQHSKQQLLEASVIVRKVDVEHVPLCSVLVCCEEHFLFKKLKTTSYTDSCKLHAMGLNDVAGMIDIAGCRSSRRGGEHVKS